MSPPQRKRVRMEGFDYSTPGAYFITINANRRAFAWFGTVRHGRLYPNAAGRVVREVWDALPDRYPGILTDAIVVMPHHVPGIIMLGTEPDVPADVTLSDVVGTFKSLSSLAYGRGVREHGWPPFRGHLWHRSFRDTIIRTERALAAYRSYIEENPGRWSEQYER